MSSNQRTIAREMMRIVRNIGLTPRGSSSRARLWSEYLRLRELRNLRPYTANSEFNSNSNSNFKVFERSQLKQYISNSNWKEVELKTLPNQDPVSLNNFRNGGKAVKVMWKAGNKNHNAYFTPNTIAGLRGMSKNNRKSNTLVMKAMGNLMGYFDPRDVVFKNPLTMRQVRRGDIRFVILKKKSPSPATRRKLAANAANKRAAASKTRGIPASQRKRSPNKSSQRTPTSRRP